VKFSISDETRDPHTRFGRQKKIRCRYHADDAEQSQLGMMVVTIEIAEC
jgi:hypothetical protein